MSTPGPVRSRPVGELVMIILALTVGAVLILSVILVGVLEIAHPELDTATAIGSVQQTVTVLAGAVVGYLAGKRSDPTTRGTNDG